MNGGEVVRTEPTAAEVFEAATALPAEERAEFLERRCAGRGDLRRRVDELLAAHERAGPFLEDPAIDAASAVLRPITEGPGDRIGPYVLRERLGEGGFGIVYRAEQVEPVQREVALKILKLGMDTEEVIRRFQAERQALARTDHPNIARMLDAGATETGRPYFVMELVRGVDVCTWCDGRRLGVDERLRLFESICRAVQHAHDRGLVHRDLKPTNVLVSEQDGRPFPKVIDFGVVKAARGDGAGATLATRIGYTVGTPVYMSPEQASLGETSLDHRSDIYTLGVLLHELLTGATPLPAERLARAAPAEIERLLREEQPRRASWSAREGTDAAARLRGRTPRALAGRLRGDLDWIVLCALEKEPARRYPTAAAMADDVRRHLEGLPVVARPPSRVYRAQRFARRHRALVAGAGLGLAALATGLAFASHGYWRARQEARLANSRSTFVQELLVGTIPPEQLPSRAREAFGDEHAAVAEALHQAALRSQEEGDLDSAVALLEESLSAWRAQHGHAHPRVARAHGRLAVALHMAGRLEAAEAHYRAALGTEEELDGSALPGIEGREGLARLLRGRGELAEAAQLLDEAASALRGRAPNRKDALARTLTSLWEVQRSSGEHERAARTYRELIAISRQAFPAESLVHAERLLVFGLTLRGFGQRDEAARLLREGIQLYRLHGFPPGETHLDGLVALAGLLEDGGDVAAALEVDSLLRDAEELARRLHGPDSLKLAKLLERRAEHLTQRGELVAATTRQKEAFEIRERALGKDFEPGGMVPALTALVWGIAQRGDVTREAYQLALEASELLRAHTAEPERIDLVTGRLELRIADRDGGRLQEVLSELEGTPAGDPGRLALLAIAHYQLGQPVVARAYLQHAETLGARAPHRDDREVQSLVAEARALVGGE